jgi:endonuclease/exonuclease/phosphatase (EEP) superfamily protein YafD
LGLALNLLAAGSWVVVSGLLLVIVARLAIPDRVLLLIWANAYTFWIYQPAYLVAAFAGLAARWRLLAAAGVVVAFHLAWILPDYRSAQQIPAQAYDAPRLRLMTANVYFGNVDNSGIAAEVGEVDPDILFLQEYGPRMEQALRDSGVADRYPYVKVANENQYFGTALYSKLPLTEVTVVRAGGRPYIRGTIEVGEHAIHLYDIHATSPGLGANIASSWNEGWADITETLRDDGEMLIAAGDFNMDQQHRWYRELKRAGFISAHEERGRGNATTWPKGRKLPPIRIDQVFHSTGIVCLSIREGHGEGSDHRPVIAELAITGR